jgi:predicted nucleic acid-binding protein
MHDRIVLDSSVIAAIFFPEKITSAAIDAAAESDCITVDLAYAEVANVAWKRVVHAGDDADAVRSSLDSCMAFIRETCDVIPARDLITPSWDLATRHHITIYDALFIAASVRCGVPLVTADEKLHAAVNTSCPMTLIR